MSWFAGLEPDEVLQVPEAAAPAQEPVPFWDTVSRSWDDTQKNRTLGAREGAFDDAIWARHRDLEKRLGRKLPTPPMGAADQPQTLFGFDVQNEALAADNAADPWSTVAGYEAQVEKLRRERPDVMAGVLTRDQVRGNVDKRLNLVAAGAAQAGGDHPFGAFLGSAGASVVDPTNLFVGVNTLGVGTGWSLLGRMGLQGGLWGAVAAAEAPLKADEAQAVGGPAYGLAEAGEDVAFAAIGGPIFEGVASGLGWGLKALARRASPSIAEPALRGAIAHGDAMDRAASFLGEQDGETFEAGLDALDRQAPPPRVEPDQELGGLFGDQPALDARAPGEGGPVSVAAQAEYKGRPITAASFDPAATDVDPARFQYKADADRQGVTARLRGVEAWDATASGKVIVWQDEAGKLFIADGHQRRALALRMQEKGWDARLDGYLFRSSDGWTARQVRTIAALKNIREGSGTILDAAKIFRDAPDAMRDRSLPITGDFMAQARGLARLDHEAFGAVVNKVIPERYGAIIGELAGDRPDLHAGLVKLIRDGEPSSADEAAALVQEGRLDDWIASEGETADMFGGLPPEATTISRAKVKAAIVRALRQDARVFGQLVRHADAIEAGGNALARNDNEAAAAVARSALEIVSRLALRSGQVGEAVAEAAARVRGGEAPAVAARGLITRIKRSLRNGEALDGVRMADVDPPAPSEKATEDLKAFDDPAGEGPQAQAVAAPEDAAIEAAPKPDEDDAAGGLFADIPDDAAPHEAALQRLRPCAPGAA